MKILGRKTPLISFCLALLSLPHLAVNLTVPRYKPMYSQIKKMFPKHIVSRHLRTERAVRRLDGRPLINGTNLGAAGLFGGAAFAFKDRIVQREQLKVLVSKIKVQMNQYFVMSQKNDEYYRDLDEHLTQIEERVEDLADSSTQKISEFGMKIRSRLAGRPFMPMISYL